MHHVALDRPRPHQRHLDHQVVEATRLAGAAAWPSAPATRPGRRPCCRRGRACRRSPGPRPGCRACQGRPAARPHQVEHAADRRQHAQRQDVDLHQAQRVEIVLVPLDHGALRPSRRSRPAPAGRAAARDDEAADVLRQVARKAAQLLGDRQPLLDARRRRIEAEFGEALRQLLALVPPGQRGGQRVDLGDAEAQRPAGVAQRAGVR
jgi:hypothetical protein